ncbi:MAG: DNA (cytosine-5-)-methyltransferase [Victivallales bacterium]
MRYASVCSGVEAASLAWMPLGWEAVFFAEIEPFPCAVLKERFPDVPNLGDMTEIKGEKYYGTVDLLVGGTPCQGFSVAGKQGGLNDPRSVLCLAYCGLLKTMRPRWFVWENVPGVFSTNQGDDFRAFLGKIDEIGYFCAWRVLDAQYVRVDGFPRAVPQRRRRVFVVGHLGADWRYPASVLFEPGCLPGNTPPRSKTGTGVARSLTASTGGASGKEQQHTFISGDGRPLNALGVDGYNGAISGEVSATVDTRCKNVNRPTLVMAHGQANAEISEAVSPALTCDHEAPIAFRWAASPSQGLPIGVDYCHALMASRNGELAVLCYENHAQDSRIKPCGECSPQINAKAGTLRAEGENRPSRPSNIVCNPSGKQTVRRLLPVECERLMGFPDNWTRIPWRGKSAEDCPDSPRYKACGNSMCVNVMRWIGMRIENVERRMKGICHE